MKNFDRNELLLKLKSFAPGEPCFVPSPLHDGLASYVCYGYRPGGFLSAVLCNDLQRACVTADPWSARSLHSIMTFVHNHIPDVAWGSPHKFEAWLGAPGSRVRVEAKRAERLETQNAISDELDTRLVKLNFVKLNCIDCGSDLHNTDSASCPVSQAGEADE